MMVRKGNHPQMAAKFRSVKYCNTPRSIQDLMAFMHVYGWYICSWMGRSDLTRPQPSANPRIFGQVNCTIGTTAGGIWMSPDGAWVCWGKIGTVGTPNIIDWLISPMKTISIYYFYQPISTLSTIKRHWLEWCSPTCTNRNESLMIPGDDSSQVSQA